MVSTLINNSPVKINIHKVKAHAGIAGNECADAIAKYQAGKANKSVADTEIPCAGPDGKEKKRKEKKKRKDYTVLRPRALREEPLTKVRGLTKRPSA